MGGHAPERNERYEMAERKGHLLRKKFLMLVGACGLGTLALHGATCVWTGGSGSWTDSANWLDGAVPSAGDTVYVSNSVANVTIDIDVPGISIASIRFEGSGRVTLTGNTLTLTGGWSFLDMGDGQGNAKNYETSTFSWFSYNSDIDCRVPLVFAPPSGNCGICATTNAIHFWEKVSIQTANTLYVHNGYQPNKADQAAGMSKDQRYGTLYFHEEVEGPNVTIRPTQSPTGEVHFERAVRVKYLKTSGYTSATMNLYSTSNFWEQAEVDYGNKVLAKVQDAYPTGTVFVLGGTWSSSAGNFNLCNFDATIDRLDATADGIKNYTVKTQGGQILSSVWNGGGADIPVTLTMNATADGTTAFMVQDKISLVWNPISDYTLTFTNRTSTTSGEITVKRGKVRLTGDAAFPNVWGVNVSTGAKFEIASSAAVPVSQNAFVNLQSGAKLVLAPNVSATVGLVSVGGAFVADGTYSGSGPNAVGWIEGDGEITVSSANVRAWNNAADGTWADASNWVNARVPDGTEKRVFICKDSAEDFTVTIAADIASFPTNLFMRNLGGGRTTLSVAADVAARASCVRVDAGARVVVPTGGAFRHSTIEPNAYNALPAAVRSQRSPASDILIAYGGEWLTSGGSTVFTNFWGTFAVRGRPGVESRFSISDGDVMFCDLSSAWPMTLFRDGVMDFSGGTCHLPHHGYNHEPDVKFRGGKLLVSGTAISTVGTFPTRNGGSFTVGTGEMAYDGAAATTLSLNSGNRIIRPNCLGETARVVMRNGATLSSKNDYMPVLVGGTVGGKAVFDYESGDSSSSRRFVVGDLAGEAELNVKAGLLRVHPTGLFVASDSKVPTVSTTSVVARVTVDEGATMYVRGSLDSGWNASSSISGIAVGAGNSPFVSGHPFKGAMYVSGSVTNEYGNTAIGWGAGDGLYVQNGGNTYLKHTITYSATPTAVIGLGGGIGRLVVSNGVFNIARGKLFVGGCPYEDIQCFHNSSHTNMAWKPTGVPANNHDAQGTIVVAGGEFRANGSVTLGADGTGVVEMDGSLGTFTAASMVLSNATASVVRFVADASGFSPVNVTGELAVSDGASVEVDISAYAGSPTKFRLFNFASFEGDVDDIPLTVLSDGAAFTKPCQLCKTDNTIDLVVISGTTLIIR